MKQKDLDAMREYVTSRGITQDELASIVDHRFWLVVRDAVKGQQVSQAAEVVKKQVKKAPKTVKSKKAVKRTNQEVQDTRSRLRASGGKNMDDVVALMKAKRK
ncbi:MAG TPA: hypothetical protein EYN14_09335 [Alphaproteobacteria bacterium]|nr:hypothetical protein [Alphaproteobacteria bacterium]